MPLEHLLSALEREAAAQVEAILAAARTEAAQIARDADARLARRRSELLGSRETELRGAAAVALGEARRTSRRTVLEARQRLFERVLGAGGTQLPHALSSAAYRAVLPEHLAQGLRALGDAPAVIRCPPSLVAAVRGAVKGRQHVTVRGDKHSGPGVTIATADGAIEADNTLTGRMERLRSRLALELAARVERRP